jgi:hypothetical protein
MTSELGMKPEDLLAVMVSESGINPGAGNKSSGASGLIQFMPGILAGTGFKGSPSDFRETSGENQLPYIKKLIEGNMKYNGGPFTSAAQYYVANLWPVALRLPGIKAGDPSTVFLEKNPATVTDPRTGKVYSKKYYDIGQRITPRQESQAYTANTLFHGSTPGAITYGDMINQVNKNKQTSTYQKALMAMKNNTGYQPPPNEQTKSINTPPPAASPSINQNSVPAQALPPKNPSSIDEMLNSLLGISEAKNTYLIQIKTADYTDAMEFARVLGSVLDEELKTRSYTYTDGTSKVELECKNRSGINNVQIANLATLVKNNFKTATKKIGSVEVYFNIVKDTKSNLQETNVKHAETNYRKFLLKFIGKI